MIGWNDLFVAAAGASAALTGLIFVCVSISLTRILSTPKLPNRAFLSLILLLAILIVSILFLIPSQSLHIIGIEILIIGSVIWIVTISIDLSVWKITEYQYKKYHIINIVLSQLATLPYIITGITILFSGLGGVYWIVPAFIFSFIKSLLDAWVLLVEINR